MSHFIFDSQTSSFTFPDTPKNAESSCISLRSIVRNFTSNPGLKGVPVPMLYNALGRFRSLLYYIELYNNGIGSNDAYYLVYIQTFVLQLVSGFGFQIINTNDKILIPGLLELINAIEAIFQDEMIEIII